MPTREALFARLDAERHRQEQLKRAGRFKHTAADREISHKDRLAILAEEFGEVAGAVVQLSGLSNDRQASEADLQRELVQVAAVCLAWLEGLS